MRGRKVHPKSSIAVLVEAERVGGCSTWRRKGPGETLKHLSVPKGAQGELERDFGQGRELTGQGGMALQQQ